VAVPASDFQAEDVAEAPARENVGHRADLDRADAHGAAEERAGGQRHEVVHRLSRLPDAEAANLESRGVSHTRFGGSGPR
jgi:hypothetical protein